MALGVGTKSEVFRRKWCQVKGPRMQEEIMLGIGTQSIGRNGARYRGNNARHRDSVYRKKWCQV